MGYKVYNLNTNYGACSFYRAIQPITLMHEMGFPIEPILDEGKATTPQHIRNSMFLESDISLIYQNIGDYTLKMMEHANTNFKALKDGETGEMHWPPTFVCDTDDDLFNVHALNMSFGNLGTRRHDGTELADGEEVGIAHPTLTASPEASKLLFAQYPDPAPGTMATLTKNRYIYNNETEMWHEFLSLWRDGQNCNYSLNRMRLDNWRKTIRQAHLVTCSTPRSAAYVTREVPEANTYVSYNGINFDDYPTVELVDHPNEVRILWEGGASHHEGLWPLNKSFERVAAKYPHAKFIFWGAPYKWAADNIPNSELRKWVPYQAYKFMLSHVNHDISIAPLAQHKFNESRSGIRFYENSAIHRPAATLAQNFGPYQDEIIEGETGMLFSSPEEFETKLAALIEDATLRQTLAANAKDWVRTNREAKAITTKLFQKWFEVREAHKQTFDTKDVEIALPTS